MSHITLIVVEGRRIHYVQTHWRTAQALLAHGFSGVFWHKHEQSWNDDLDAGYILVDLNRNVLVNGQDAFAPERKGMDVVAV
jgi:hypothetical protein